MGLCFKTSRWLDRLWGEHLELSESARKLVQQGVEKQGDRFAGFPADCPIPPMSPISIPRTFPGRLREMRPAIGSHSGVNPTRSRVV